jgi:hypothetical protein
MDSLVCHTLVYPKVNCGTRSASSRGTHARKKYGDIKRRTKWYKLVFCGQESYTSL